MQRSPYSEVHPRARTLAIACVYRLRSQSEVQSSRELPMTSLHSNLRAENHVRQCISHALCLLGAFQCECRPIQTPRQLCPCAEVRYHVRLSSSVAHRHTLSPLSLGEVLDRNIQRSPLKKRVEAKGGTRARKPVFSRPSKMNTRSNHRPAPGTSPTSSPWRRGAGPRPAPAPGRLAPQPRSPWCFEILTFHFFP